MNVSQKGIDLIKSFEGLKLEAYPDPATGDDPWTIGYGTTVYPSGKKVSKGDIITKNHADYCLNHDVQNFSQGVESLIKVPTTQGQFDAMVSLAYNIGLGAFSKSTLLRKHNDKCYSCAANQFPLWNKAAGKVMSGLIRRRAAERELYAS